MPIALTLRACEDFRPADVGYLTTRGVWKVTGYDVAMNTLNVRARDFVGAGAFGVFDAIEQQPRPVRNGGVASR